MDIKQKVCIITGASKGIGLEISKALLEEEVQVAGWSRSAPDLDHPNFKHIPVDISNGAEVEKAYEQTKETFGKPASILVNNAGIGHRGGIDSITPEEWYQLFNTNVHGIFHATRVVVPDMKKQDEGHIFNISSGAGTNGISEMAAYCGSKHAVHGISHALFNELRNFGIKVTCLAPGSVHSQFSEAMGQGPVKKNALDPGDLALAIVQAVKMPKNFHYMDMEVRPLQPNKT